MSNEDKNLSEDEQLEKSKTIWRGFKKIITFLRTHPNQITRSTPNMLEFIGDTALKNKEDILEMKVNVQDILTRLNSLDDKQGV